MKFQSLPKEVHLCIVDHCEKNADISAWCRTNQYFYSLLRPTLFARNVRDSNGSALIWAATWGNEEVARRSIAAGADVNAAYNEGAELRQATSDGFLEKWLPLHYAANGGHIGIMRILVDSGADINGTAEKLSSTPLVVCDFRRETVEFLIAHGAIVSMEELDRTGKGRGTLRPAVANADGGVLELLLDNGASLEDENERSFYMLPHLAAAADNIAGLRFLLERGMGGHFNDDGSISIDSSGLDHGRSIFYGAIRSGKIRVIRWLFDHGVKLSNYTDHDVGVFVHEAALAEESAVLGALLDQGIDISGKSGSSETYLYYLCSKLNETRGIRRVLEFGAGVNIANDRGMRPIHNAAANAAPEGIEILLEYGADIDPVDNFGMRPIHYACLHGRLENVRFLVSRGAMLRGTDHKGETALHMACHRGYLDVAQYLVDEHGFDPSEQDGEGNSAFESFDRAKKWEEVQFHKKNGGYKFDFEPDDWSNWVGL